MFVIRYSLVSATADSMGAFGHDRVQVADDTVMGYAEDGSIFIAVDCDNFSSFFHARTMLDRTADADCDIQSWPYRRASLAYLVIVVDIAKVDRSPAATYGSAEAMGEIPELLEVFLRANARTTSDDDTCCLEVDLLRGAMRLDDSQGQFKAV